MKASIEDVARQAGVSTATVSRAFSRPDMVSAKTRAKVMEAAQQLDFSVSRMAGILKSGRSHRVALLVGSSKLDWFTSRIIEGLNEVLRSAGYDLVIQPIGDAGAREEFFDELPVRGNADAVIVSSFAITPAEIRRLNTTRIPLIGINTASQGFTASVGIDDKAGIRLIVRHLTTLGHRNLLYLYETFDATMGFSSHNRVTGFLEACSELDGVTGQTMDMQAGDDPVDAALTALLARDDAPTALCFHQDSLAIPLFFRLRQCGMAIPTDLSVTGFDNSTFSGEVGLTTVRQKPYDMAVAAARKRGEKVVMTNGVFDILHAGHVSYLANARKLGDRLIVAVNSDASTKRLKGETRPVNPLEQRMIVLGALEAVDWVVSFEEDTPQRLIAGILPDLLVKGGDYKPEQIAGSEEVWANGGEVMVLNFEDGCSTTNIIRKIQKDSQ